MRITVLIENSAPEGLVAEHGLSFYLEYRGGRYLLDAGESGAFLLNAQRLGVDLSRVEAAGPTATTTTGTASPPFSG